MTTPTTGPWTGPDLYEDGITSWRAPTPTGVAEVVQEGEGAPYLAFYHPDIGLTHDLGAFDTLSDAQHAAMPEDA